MAKSSRSGFTLSRDPAVRYSPSEKKVFPLLSSRKKSSREIAERYYDGAVVAPFNRQRIISGILSSLVKKTRHNGERFVISCGKRQGPHPIEYWLEAIDRQGSQTRTRQRPSDE